ncbi:MAG: DegV family protein [Dehalococcoidia bacterium]|nr:DegV family protein [Dehalococcoidia bacterium]
MTSTSRTSPTSSTAGAPLHVVVDAHLSLPPDLARSHGIVSAPADTPLLIERENIPRLALEAAALPEAGEVVEACRRAAAGGAAVLYVTPGSDRVRGEMAAWGHPAGGVEAARAAVEAEGGRFLHLPSDDLLMAAGWRAVVAAEAAAAGATPDQALARASEAATRLLALVEHPELAGDAMPGNPDTTQRILTFVRADGFSLHSMPRSREDALRALRDRFAAAAGNIEAPRVVVHHGGSAAAAQAMATWIARHAHPAEVHIAPITRHAGTRLGPGFLAIAWLEP